MRIGGTCESTNVGSNVQDGRSKSSNAESPNGEAGGRKAETCISQSEDRGAEGRENQTEETTGQEEGGYQEEGNQEGKIVWGIG